MTTLSGYCIDGLHGVLCKTRDSESVPCGCACHHGEASE